MMRKVFLTLTMAAALGMIVGGCKKAEEVAKKTEAEKSQSFKAKYDQVKNGMTPVEVEKIMGAPTDRKQGGGEVLGIGGTAMTWVYKDGKDVANIKFANDKVTGKDLGQDTKGDPSTKPDDDHNH